MEYLTFLEHLEQTSYHFFESSQVRTRLTNNLTCINPFASNNPATRSASLIAVISGVVTIIASFAGDIALIKPTSIPAGQSINIKLYPRFVIEYIKFTYSHE